MAESLAQQLMRWFRRRAPVEATLQLRDDLPATPPPAELRDAATAARTGRATDCERFASLLLAADRDPAEAESRAIAEELLLAAGPRMWRDLDLAVRRSWWRTPTTSTSEGARMISGQAEPLGLVVASFHPSGHVREAAVARLEQLRGPLSARALTLRTSDWVPQVRSRARAAIEQYLSSADGLLLLGELAEQLASRLQGRWLADQFETAVAALADPDLDRLRAATDWRTRRVAYRVALAKNRLPLAELLEAAGRDGDVVIRTECAGAAIRMAASNGDLGPVRSLAGSGTAAIRASAVNSLARAGDTDVAMSALLDRNPVVREVAQAAVRRVGVDPAVEYRRLVSATDPPEPAAVAGLGETGSVGDAELVFAALAHPRTRGRVEAVRALRRLGVLDIDTLVPMLQDPAAAVTRQVVLSLRSLARQVPAAELEPLIAATKPAHVRSAAYRVLREQDVWTRLRVDLELYDDADQVLRDRARGDVTGWLAREAATTYSMPSGATADRLDALVTGHADNLDTKSLRLLRFHLGLTGRASGG